MEGRDRSAVVYDRTRLKSGNRIPGPAIIIEMDSTTVILPRHHGRVDPLGNVLIYPDKFTARTPGRSAARAARKRTAAKTRSVATSRGRPARR
jgi:hypothetical protein